MFKRLWITMLLLAGLITLPLAARAVTISSNLENVNAITLTWSDDPQTTQTVSWKTNTSVATSSIQYQPAGLTPTASAAFQKKEAVREEWNFASGDHAERFHFFWVTLTALKPGTKYQYAIAAGATVSPAATFATEEKNVENFKFLVFGDSQSGDFRNPDYALWHQTIRNAYQRNPDARFFVNVGDLVEVGQSTEHWRQWFNAAQGVIDTIPALPVQGNHETFSLTLFPSDPKPVYYMHQFRLFQNGPEGLKTQVYSYDYGPVHFVVLDSQQAEESARYGDILKAQQVWLAQDLAATRQPWKIAFFHKPPFYNRPARPNDAVKTAFCPLFDQYHVDLVLNGHEHILARTPPMKGGRAQASAQEGTVYYVTGRSGAKYYHDSAAGDWDAFFYSPKDQPCYETLQIQKNALTITAWKMDGTLVDTYTIHKSP
jgi:hypothetical protein